MKVSTFIVWLWQIIKKAFRLLKQKKSLTGDKAIRRILWQLSSGYITKKEAIRLISDVLYQVYGPYRETQSTTKDAKPAAKKTP